MNIYATYSLLFTSIIFRKSKILAILFFAFMWTLWGWNTWNGDYDAYSLQFEKSNEIFGNYEIGYNLLNSIFLNLGFDFQNFMIIFSFFVLYIILYICIKYTKYPALFSAIYFFIFIQEFVFMRNYLANILFYIAIWLSFIEIKNYKKWYCCIILLASLFHSTSIIYIIFLPALKNKLLNIKHLLFYVFIIFTASIFLFDTILPFLGADLINKYNEYAVGGRITNTSFAHLIIVAIIYTAYKIIFSQKKDYIPHISKRICTIITNINLLSIFYLSLYYHVPYFASRFLRCLLTIDLIFFTIVLFYAQSHIKRIKILSLLSIFIIYIILIFLTDTLPYTLFPLYKCNLIWGDEYYIPIL